MDSTLLLNMPLAPASHPYDLLTPGERRRLARIESKTVARIKAYARYTDARHHDLRDRWQGPHECEFVAFVLAKDRWTVDMFLDWMGIRAAPLGPPPPDHAVDALIELLHRLDEAMALESAADVETLFAMSRCRASREGIEATLLARYRGRFIASPLREPRFARRLAALTTPAQLARIRWAVL
jgi:hypothetical protein